MTVTGAELLETELVLTEPDKFWEKHKHEDGYVYFIPAFHPNSVGAGIEHSEFIKIGRSLYPRKRVDELKTGTPYFIYLHDCFIGGKEAEKQLHNKFKHHRADREWFYTCQEIIDFIEQSTDTCMWKELH